jgi:hypothetical protein
MTPDRSVVASLNRTGRCGLLDNSARTAICARWCALGSATCSACGAGLVVYYLAAWCDRCTDWTTEVGSTPVARRPFHAFLSHAHVDKVQADVLFEWLRDIVGVPIWYDGVNLPVGATIAQALPEAIENSRAMILFLSSASVTRGWVQQEYNAALNHQTQNPAFRIVPVRIDDVSPPGFLQNYSHLTLNENGLDAVAAAGLLKALYQPMRTIDHTNGRNVYMSRGWHPSDAPLAGAICSKLADAGLQLIGDAEDQSSWIEERIAGIMDGCGAFAAVLPHRPTAEHQTSKYILREWGLAAARNLPCLVVRDVRVELPPEAAAWPGLIDIAVDEQGVDNTFAEYASAFADDWQPPARSPYVFYAADFSDETKSLRGQVKQLVEAVTAMPCIQGEYVTGNVVQREILRSVAGASLVLADISGEGPNVYVELGAARGADVPVAILRRGAPGRPVFMLRDQQVWDYSKDADLLGRVARIVYPHRRSLIDTGSS